MNEPRSASVGSMPPRRVRGSRGVLLCVLRSRVGGALPLHIRARVRRVQLILTLVTLVACGQDAVERSDDDAGTRTETPAATVTLDEQARALSGVQFARARVDTVQGTISTTGVLAWDPSAISDVSTPMRGRVLRLRGDVGDRLSARSVVAVIENPDNLSGRFEVRAPRGGVVTERAASVGQVLEPGARLLRVVDDSHLWLLVDLPPGLGARPAAGAAVSAELPALGIPVRGRMGPILPEVDSITRTVRTRVVIENPRHTLAAGMSALVTIGVGARVPAVVVPRSAVVFMNGRTVVFTPWGDAFQAVEVETGAAAGDDHVAVTRGLTGGERVVTVGAQQLANANFDFRGLGDDDEEEEDEQ